ncbi:MAG TPA: FAD-dependent oxidoreductase [Methylomirabilota bacterium]|nr:FAD-dependent oxidoreductase [Methylomirabilota bacterium]
MQVFHGDVYATTKRAPSHWAATADVASSPALATDIATDVAIVGGGYTGLSTALHLARDHGIGATVLEAGPIGWGASGRNGGFVSLGATKLGIAAMDRRWGAAETDRFHRSQMEAVETVRGLIASEGIDAEAQGDAAYEVAHRPGVAGDLAEQADLYRRRFGFDAKFLSKDAFLAEGHGGTEQFGAVRLRGPFAIHPLKFTAGLRDAAVRRGAQVFQDSAVREWSQVGGRHRLTTAGGSVTARIVVLATNGYTPDDLAPAFANRTLPALSNILVTRPLTADERAAEGWRTECPVSNARDLLFYYRLLPDRRFLFGARGGVSGSEAENRAMRSFLERRLGEVFPSWRGVAIDRFWNGLVCLTGRLTPAVDRLDADPTVFHGFGYHGNGVNTAPWAGARIADAIAAGGDARPDVPAAMRGLPPHLVHPLVRRLGLRAAYAWYGVRERWSGR